jgi:isopropylmalate/homocitrate/citramalate synthase
VATNVDTGRLLPTIHSILEVLDERVATSKPLLGDGVFAHESGLHTAAMLDDPATFEPFDPAMLGGERRLLFGRSSGRGAARRLLERAGVEATPERVERLLDALHSCDDDLPLEVAVALAADVAER